MGGESTKALFNTLLITNIAINPGKNSRLRPRTSRQMQTRLGHQTQQTDGLETNGFPAGIRSGNHQGMKIFAQFQINGDNLPCKQRMTSSQQTNEALIIN